MEENEKSKTFGEIIAGANQLNLDRLCADPEWTDKEYYHIHTLITAFSDGILTSYPYYKSYQLPPNFEKVMNFMSLEIQKYFSDILPQVNLMKMRGLYRKIAMQCPEYVAWNDIGNPEPNGIYGVSRDTPTRDIPEFIDLDVPPHNACLYLRMHTREDKKFEADFGHLWKDKK